jgi:hypothetical protein
MGTRRQELLPSLQQPPRLNPGATACAIITPKSPRGRCTQRALLYSAHVGPLLVEVEELAAPDTGYGLCLTIVDARTSYNVHRGTVGGDDGDDVRGDPGASCTPAMQAVLTRGAASESTHALKSTLVLVAVLVEVAAGQSRLVWHYVEIFHDASAVPDRVWHWLDAREPLFVHSKTTRWEISRAPRRSSRTCATDRYFRLAIWSPLCGIIRLLTADLSAEPGAEDGRLHCLGRRTDVRLLEEGTGIEQFLAVTPGPFAGGGAEGGGRTSHLIVALTTQPTDGSRPHLVVAFDVEQVSSEICEWAEGCVYGPQMQQDNYAGAAANPARHFQAIRRCPLAPPGCPVNAVPTSGSIDMLPQPAGSTGTSDSFLLTLRYEGGTTCTRVSISELKRARTDPPVVKEWAAAVLGNWQRTGTATHCTRAETNAGQATLRVREAAPRRPGSTMDDRRQVLRRSHAKEVATHPLVDNHAMRDAAVALHAAEDLVHTSTQSRRPTSALPYFASLHMPANTLLTSSWVLEGWVDGEDVWLMVAAEGTELAKRQRRTGSTVSYTDLLMNDE